MKVSPRDGRRLQFVKLETAQVPYKKWKAYFQDENGKEFVRYFGGTKADGTEFPDYTKGASDAQKIAYRRRNAKDLVKPKAQALEHNDELFLTAPAILAYELLWNTPDLQHNIREYKRAYLRSNFFAAADNGTGDLQSEESSDGSRQ
jgi:hypothetical protein